MWKSHNSCGNNGDNFGNNSNSSGNSSNNSGNSDTCTGYSSSYIGNSGNITKKSSNWSVNSSSKASSCTTLAWLQLAVYVVYVKWWILHRPDNMMATNITITCTAIKKEMNWKKNTVKTSHSAFYILFKTNTKMF